MTAIASKLSPLPVTSSPLIFDLSPAPLSNVPFHENTHVITRYFAENFPLHLAVHEVSPVLHPPAVYTHPHTHEDADEVNIIISTNKLAYGIQLDNATHIVTNNACIWIPKGMVHAANVLKGSGFFITLRLPYGFADLMLKMKDLYSNFHR